MGKTLAIILNHNRKEMTDRLFRSLKPYERDDYDLHVLDNGSNNDELSIYTSYQVNTNVYYGGAVNLIFAMMVGGRYDSVLILNNDLILHPYNFVKTLRNAMFTNGYHVVSPSVLQPEEGQCFWKQMHNWNSPIPREVKWVDFMCPLIHADVVKEIKTYHEYLNYGWGQDVYTGVVCEQKGWKTAVLDTVPVIHLSSQTFKDGKAPLTMNEYSNKAMDGMVRFFNHIGQGQKLAEFRHWGQNYQCG